MSANNIKRPPRLRFGNPSKEYKRQISHAIASIPSGVRTLKDMSDAEKAEIEKKYGMPIKTC